MINNIFSPAKKKKKKSIIIIITTDLKQPILHQDMVEKQFNIDLELNDTGHIDPFLQDEYVCFLTLLVFLVLFFSLLTLTKR